VKNAVLSRGFFSFAICLQISACGQQPSGNAGNPAIAQRPVASNDAIRAHIHAQPEETRIVNTPVDGFLSLRSEPSTSQGKRLLKIPHGTLLQAGDCVSTTRAQRWCRTTYQGQSGWVLDRYLTSGNSIALDTIGTGQNAHHATPGIDSPLREQILDLVRGPAQRKFGQPINFKISTLRVTDRWAFLMGDAIQSNGKPIEFSTTPGAAEYFKHPVSGFENAPPTWHTGVIALLKKDGTGWQIVHLDIGESSDAYWQDVGFAKTFGAPNELFLDTP